MRLIVYIKQNCIVTFKGSCYTFPKIYTMVTISHILLICCECIAWRVPMKIQNNIDLILVEKCDIIANCLLIC